MHPGFIHWWRSHSHQGRPHGCGSEAACGPGAEAGFGERRGFGPWAEVHFGSPDDGDFGGGAFGVRRPLRFLAHKLDLKESQVAELAKILEELKTERAQGAVDHRRTTSSFADAIGGETFDEEKVREGAEARVKSADRLKAVIVRALGRLHAILEPEQRAKLAYLLRTGALSI